MCSPIAAGDSRNEETSVWPPRRRNARHGPRTPDRDPERVSLSFPPIRRHDHLSDMCLAYLIARVRPSLSLVYLTPSPSPSPLPAPPCMRVSERGWIGAVKNERDRLDSSGLRNPRVQMVTSARRSDKGRWRAVAFSYLDCSS